MEKNVSQRESPVQDMQRALNLLRMNYFELSLSLSQLSSL